MEKIRKQLEQEKSEIQSALEEAEVKLIYPFLTKVVHTSVMWGIARNIHGFMMSLVLILGFS